jgi:hypothetical protein
VSLLSFSFILLGLETSKTEEEMRWPLAIATITLLSFSLQAGPITQGRGPAPRIPELVFQLALKNDSRQALAQSSVTTPNADLHTYGDGSNIVVATGGGPQLPRLFFGLCQGPCGFTLRDRNSTYDLRGTAHVKFTTIVSGFHRVRPLIKLVDGTLLIGDQAEGSTADYHQYQISFSDCRWLRLDPVRGVTLGGNWIEPDLSKVDEVGLFDVIPGSGAWTVSGASVEKQPPPPAGGWIAISSFELWGQREARK